MTEKRVATHTNPLYSQKGNISHETNRDITYPLSAVTPKHHAQEYTQMSLPEGAVVRLGKGYVREILYSPDGARLAVVSSIGVWLYDTTTYREVALLTGHTAEVMDVAFSPDGTSLASGSEDSTVLLWDTATGELVETLTEHTDPTASVVFSPDGTILASGSFDSTVRLWDTETWEPKGILTGHTGPVTSVVFSPDGTTLASASFDTTVRLWDAETRRS